MEIFEEFFKAETSGNLPELPAIADFGALRKGTNEAYMVYCCHFLPCVIGRKKWKKAGKGKGILARATETDEAFGLLLLENNWEKWVAESTKMEIIPPTKWTSNAKSAGPNEGWDNLGRRRYNELCNLCSNDREENGEAFDAEFHAKLGDTEDKQKTVASNKAPVEQCVNILPDTDDEEEGDGMQGNGIGVGGQQIFLPNFSMGDIRR